MDAMVMSKDRLDVAVRPTGESLIFRRTGVGIEDLIARLGALSPKMVATGLRPAPELFPWWNVHLRSDRIRLRANGTKIARARNPSDRQL
jgi:hypothetical protein